MPTTIVEHIEHPFAKGNLTSDGIQWSAEKTTSTDGYETVEEVTVNPPVLGTVIEFEFGLTCAIKSSGATESALFKWQARHQFRWNQSSEELNVKQIVSFVLARAGIKLEIVSESSLITSYYPDFTIHTGNRGTSIIKDLLSLVPDVLFIEGNKAYLVNPLSSDNSIYSYGLAHAIFEGSYRHDAWALNRIQVEGYDPTGDAPIIVDTFSWSGIDKLYDRLKQVQDRNIDTVTKAGQLGAACLRRAEMESVTGFIRIPVNCGQQLYDVIDVTDSRAGLNAEKKRVVGMTLVHNPAKGEYEQRLLLGGV